MPDGGREPRERPDEDSVPPHLEGVSPENWRLLREHERVHRMALDVARRQVDAELARPRERNLSNLGVTVVASVAFGIIALALFTMGLGPWSLLPLALLVPAVLLAVGYGLLVLGIRPRTPESGGSGMAE
ncbi:hypothetical protein ADK52_09000 [Streptomyces sp. WM6372]|uniref:hypothetical protein n=1 Tax=Streptomyces sp. WM6372 TaxID=1415555 RepID=UPI0006AF3653|nr:hypothetical protein [Streptomyces sp. WM6372]KOU26851.1 hypothetical protein ADK52_09000 [Streptomyces sp. WM6372]